MKPTCPKCKRPRRVYEKLKKINRKWYWLEHCVTCKAVISINEREDGTFEISS